MYDEILRQLEIDETFRERKNKNLGIAEILVEKYHINASPDRVKAIIEDANSMDRYWRLILGERKDLRGNDYDTKRKVEEEKEMELGYSPHFHQDNAQLKML